MKSWSGVKVLIIGAARQGLALARYLSSCHANVTLNDRHSPEQMKSAVEELASRTGSNVRWVLGSHPISLLDNCDVVCVSGGVSLDMELIAEARRRGLPLTNDSQIFLEVVPCRVIGITGSAGKTTTTTLVGRIAAASLEAPRKAWVGGNIGLPLIEYVDQIQLDDLVVLELSSFQLELMTHSPEVAALLNITPNHLDRHGDIAAYTSAKARILDFQDQSGMAILNREDPGSWNLRSHVHGRLVSFGLARPQDDLVGTYVQNGHLTLFDGTVEREIVTQDANGLRGEHNLYNILAAFAIAYAAGLPVTSMAAGLEGFQGVDHRLELVREWKGAKWYNDSIATAPERTIAAIQSFDEPLVLMLGGRDKNLPWDRLAELIHTRVDHVVVFGEASAKIIAAIGSVQPDHRPYSISECRGLIDAVEAAADICEAGDVILLSPGATSYDEFRDFEERGETFRKWLNKRP